MGSLQQQLLEAQNQTKATENHFAMLLQEANDMISALKGELTATGRNVEILNNTLQVKEMDTSSSAPQHGVTMPHEAKQKLGSHQNQVDVSQASTSQETVERRQMEEAIAALQQELAGLKQANADKESTTAHETAGLASELDALQAQLQNAQKKYTDVQIDLENARSQVFSKDQQLNQAREKATQLEQELTAKANECTLVTDRIADLEAQIESLKQNLTARDMAYKHLKQTKLKLETSLTNQAATHEQSLADLQTKLEELQRVNSEQAQRLTAGEQLLKAKQEELASVKEQISQQLQPQQQLMVCQKSQALINPDHPQRNSRQCSVNKSAFVPLAFCSYAGKRSKLSCTEA
eukprot:m.235789 g.235789  ORF g.235789 m.235789 type:complete len:351 (+) comp17094_c1_seq1:1378-2430(+)